MVKFNLLAVMAIALAVQADMDMMNKKLRGFLRKYGKKLPALKDPFYIKNPHTGLFENKKLRYNPTVKLNNWLTSWAKLLKVKRTKVHTRVITLESIGDYGCWCNFNSEERWKIKRVVSSTKMDELDALCKKLHDGYNCLKMDGVCNTEDGQDPIEGVKWKLDKRRFLSTNIASIKTACAKKFNRHPCQKRVCLLENIFIIDLFTLYQSQTPLDVQFRHKLIRVPEEFSPKEWDTMPFPVMLLGKKEFDFDTTTRCRAKPVPEEVLSVHQRYGGDEMIMDWVTTTSSTTTTVQGIFMESLFDSDIDAEISPTAKKEIPSSMCCGLFPERIPFNTKVSESFPKGLFHCCKNQNVFNTLTDCCSKDGSVSQSGQLGTCN